MAQGRWSLSAYRTPDLDLLGIVGRKRSGTDPTGYRQVPLGLDEEGYYNWTGTGWAEDVWDDTDHEEDAVPRTGRLGFRELESKKTVHRFSTAEEQRMNLFEAIDYWEPNSKLYRDHLVDKRKQGRGTKWVVYALIGVSVGTMSFMLMNTIELLSEYRRHLAEDALDYLRTHPHLNETSVRWRAFSLWLAISIGLITFSTGLCGMWPPAAGSGVPDVMAYLNGVMFPKVFNIRTLLAKIASCSAAVAGGLPVGPEGPMIHIGALVGAGLGTGRSRTLGSTLGFMRRFRNPRDHREFITGGAAAGVACAFSAPIGGLLFVIEEMSSFFSKKAMWMSFFSSLIAVITANSLLSNFKGWSLRDDINTKCTEWGSWNAQYTILFKANVIENVNLVSLPFTMLLGVLCGLLGALFTFCNIKVVRFRMYHVNKSVTRRMLEPVIIVILFLTISFTCCLAIPCRPKPVFSYNITETSDLQYFDAICTDKEKEYHPFATLMFASADNCVRWLFHRDHPHETPHGSVLDGAKIFGYTVLGAWLCIYLAFACWSAGTYLACGLVVPMMIIGATAGRLYGLAVSDIMQNLLGENCDGVDAWVDPGVFALFGAAGFFAGVSRLTFSLCVIMLEITGDLPHLPNIMLCAMVAKVVADSFTHPLYHALLEVKCVPFLDWDIHLPYLDFYTARDLMKGSGTRMVVFHTRESLENIIHQLQHTSHNAFPVVTPLELTVAGNEGEGTFRGIILRSQLEQLLWYIQCNYTSDDDSYITNLTYDKLVEMREMIFWKRLKGIPFKDGLPPELHDKVLDMMPFTNTSAFSVPDSFSVSATYTLFRGMGLRHLVVVNKYNSVIGMITRKDLIAHNILKHTTESNALSTFTEDTFGGLCSDKVHPNDGGDGSCAPRVPTPEPQHYAEDRVGSSLYHRYGQIGRQPSWGPTGMKRASPDPLSGPPSPHPGSRPELTPPGRAIAQPIVMRAQRSGSVVLGTVSPELLPRSPPIRGRLPEKISGAWLQSGNLSSKGRDRDTSGGPSTPVSRDDDDRTINKILDDDLPSGL